MTADQVREIGVVADAFAEGPDDSPVFGNRYADITTRQDIQLHWIRIEDVPRIWQRFWDVGLTTVQACGDSARNVLLVPGVGGRRRRAVRRAAGRPGDLGLLHRATAEYANLPRKFKIERHRLPRGLRPGGDQRHRAVAGRAGRRDPRLQRAGRRRSVRRRAHGVGHRRLRPARPGRRAVRGPSPRSSASSATGRTAVWPGCATWCRSSDPRDSGEALDERTAFIFAPAGEELTTRYRGDHVGVHARSSRASSTSGARSRWAGCRDRARRAARLADT